MSDKIKIKKKDVEKMNDDELLDLQAVLSDKIVNIINKANKDANKLLNAYGMEIQLVMEIKKK